MELLISVDKSGVVNIPKLAWDLQVLTIRLSKFHAVNRMPTDCQQKIRAARRLNQEFLHKSTVPTTTRFYN